MIFTKFLFCLFQVRRRQCAITSRTDNCRTCDIPGSTLLSWWTRKRHPLLRKRTEHVVPPTVSTRYFCLREETTMTTMKHGLVRTLTGKYQENESFSNRKLLRKFSGVDNIVNITSNQTRFSDPLTIQALMACMKLSRAIPVILVKSLKSIGTSTRVGLKILTSKTFLNGEVLQY